MWKEGVETHEFAFHEVEDRTSSSSVARYRLIKSRGLKRMLLLLLLFVLVAFSTWVWYFRPRLAGDWELREGFLTSENTTYGTAKVEKYDGVKVQNLHANLLPGGGQDTEGKRRLIFVGDIHGCSYELKKLLKLVEFDEPNDHLIAVGDVISKGPDNVGVLNELIRLSATSVRGNHEDRLFALAHSIMESTLPAADAETSNRGSEKDKALLHQLSHRHIKYLQHMPLILRIPPLPMASKSSDKIKSPIAEEILVVHAGLVPAVSLERQDPYFVMNMRLIRTKSHLPLVDAEDKKGKSKPWHNIWGWYNDRLFRKKSLKDFRMLDFMNDEDSDSWLGKLGLVDKMKWPKPQVVVYGHHAKAGLQIGRWSKGLDTGCVKGGKLTAMILDAKGRTKIVSMDCQGYKA